MLDIRPMPNDVNPILKPEQVDFPTTTLITIIFYGAMAIVNICLQMWGAHNLDTGN